MLRFIDNSVPELCEKPSYREVWRRVACPQVPYCIDGGPGYADFLEVMADPGHPEHEDMLEWHGGTFDPTVFEWERDNQWLKEIKV